jgi:transposase
LRRRHGGLRLGALSGRSGAVGYLGEIINEPGAISKLCDRLRTDGRACELAVNAVATRSGLVTKRQRLAGTPRRGGAVADSDEGGRSGEDKSPLRDHARPSSSSRRVHPRLRPVVDGLQVMRGIALIKLVTEVGDFTRFSNPRQLMAYFGMVPGERSSGETTRRGGINKAGNTHARRALVEGAWAYRMKARIGRHKVEALPKVVRDIGWKAQVRLRTRYRRRRARDKTTNV